VRDAETRRTADEEDEICWGDGNERSQNRQVQCGPPFLNPLNTLTQQICDLIWGVGQPLTLKKRVRLSRSLIRRWWCKRKPYEIANNSQAIIEPRQGIGRGSGTVGRCSAVAAALPPGQ